MIEKGLTAKEVQSRYGIAERTLYRWIDAGRFPKPITIGIGRKRWLLEDLDSYDRSLKDEA